MRRLLIVLPVLLLALGCDPEIPRSGRVERVIAQFDPAAPTPVIPIPNDLARNAQTGLLEIPDAADATAAQRALNAYLRTLDGFPTTSVARTKVSGPLDPATVTLEALRVLDITDPAAVAPLVKEVSLSYDPQTLELSVSAPWRGARKYAVTLLAGLGGLRGANGEEVIGSAAFALLRARNSLVTCADLASPDCAPTTTLIGGEDATARREAAVALERVRRDLQPGLELLESVGIPRTHVAAMWSFSTTRLPLATFDPGAGVVPFPTDLLLEDGRVALPEDPDDDPSTLALKAGLNQLDGFSTTAKIRTESDDLRGAADRRLDAATLAEEHLLLVPLDSPSAPPVEVVRACRSCGTGANPPGAEPDELTLKPVQPLAERTRYAVLWRKGVRGLEDPREVRPSPLFVLAGLDVPLFEGGRSQLDNVSDADAEKLEELRQKTAPAIAAAAARGIPREELLLAWTFTTQTTASALVELARLPTTWGLPTAVSDVSDVDLSVLSSVSQRFQTDYHSAIRGGKEGSFTSGSALDPAATETPSSGRPYATLGAFTPQTLATPTPEPVRFLLLLPKSPKHADGGIPVVVFQHGLTRSRRDAMLIANTLAQAGYATLAIDAPMHGVRAFCHTDSACVSPARCVENRCEGGAYRLLADDPFGTTEISGQQFISSLNLLHTRDHFRQQIIDLAQLMRVLADPAGIGAAGMDDPATPQTERLLTAQIGFIGQSLGGIIGTLATAVLPQITRATLNVPGASQTDMMLESESFSWERQQFQARLERRGISPGTQPYDFYLDLARWAMDPADPQNVARHLYAEPLPDPFTGAAMAPKPTFVSWVKNDETIPNSTTELLLSALPPADPQVFKQQQYPAGGHAFLLNVFNSSIALPAQAEAVGWIDR